MKAEDHFNFAQLILDKLYKKDYFLNGVEYTKKEMYKIYMKHLRNAAYRGFPKAEYELGQTYEDVNFWGVNTHYSPKKCIYWYTKACANNYAAACNNLAGFYEEGIGCEKNFKKAFSLYEKSANLGYKYAKQNYKLFKQKIKDGIYIL